MFAAGNAERPRRGATRRSRERDALLTVHGLMQGGEHVVDKLKPVSPGVYRTTQPMSLVRLACEHAEPPAGRRALRRRPALTSPVLSS